MTARGAPAPVPRSRWRPAGLWALGLLAFFLGGLLWLITVAVHGFAFSPDSMSYASLARGFASGHPFVGGILWQGARPGRLQAIWPPLYPALIALVHVFGAGYPRAELICSGLAVAAATACGALAVRQAASAFPWAAIAVLAGFAPLLYVGGYGWSEPPALALLGLHYLLLAVAAREAARGRVALSLLFAQALAAALAVLCRYAALPFVATTLVAPVLIGAVAAGRRPLRGRVGPAARAAGASLVGLALGLGPWMGAAWLLAGHIGDPYLPVGAGVHAAREMARQAVHDAIAQTIALQDAHAPVVARAEHHLLLATLLACAVAAGIAVLMRQRARRPADGLFPAALLLGVLACDTAAYFAVLITLRAHLYFDGIGLRLAAPGLYPALLGVLLLVAAVPWPLPRQALALPLGLLILWHGWPTLRHARHHSAIAASLDRSWCSGGASGDCAMFAWLQTHTDDRDLLVGNAPFTINFALGRTTEEIAAYPYNPRPAADDFARWYADWLALVPGGRVLVVLDADTGPAADAAVPYGPLVASLWQNAVVVVGDGLTATRLTSGAAYRVLQLKSA